MDAPVIEGMWWLEECTTDTIEYSRCRPYKYTTRKHLKLQSSIKGYEFTHPMMRMEKDGTFYIKARYSYDGASGPTIDTKSSMRGAAGHDGIYQATRLKLLPISCRALADNDIERWTCEDGMFGWRAKCWHFFLGLGGGPAANPRDENKYREILVAP